MHNQMYDNLVHHPHNHQYHHVGMIIPSINSNQRLPPLQYPAQLMPSPSQSSLELQRSSANVHGTLHSQSSTPCSSIFYSRFENLRLQINELHLSYINRSDAIMKLKLRTKIDLLLRDYLAMILHQDKFQYREILNCLESSIKKKDFEPSMVMKGFEAIETYATNLLNYPWRHEYHKIYAFNGFFHRFIKCSMMNYDKIFSLMGYIYHSSTDVYKLIEIPIDPDKMIQISLECLISIAEIRLMMEVKSKYPNVSWTKILLLRMEHICSAENLIEILHDTEQSDHLIDFDVPDYGVKNFNNEFDINNSRSSESEQYLIKPPPNYLESDLDSVETFQASPRLESRRVFDSPNKFASIARDRSLIDNFSESSPLPPLSSSVIASNKTQAILSEIETNDSKNNWSCQSCTFHNEFPAEICIMCHRSRTKGNESTPLMTGGRECNQCTLVNDKDEEFCKACGTSLTDSPTYI
ncbi:hypothetical protein QR98_0000880 [Sarcoptes scabiei]|uniref:Uncharacterized protein n=1 Tax=Sarcoptes scabiei TaxID=52283 RepID=A0A131ZT73_SARSC|nr:hypothetical protein QR98_0000880 [Sarcoptes scabiei]